MFNIRAKYFNTANCEASYVVTRIFLLDKNSTNYREKVMEENKNLIQKMEIYEDM